MKLARTAALTFLASAFAATAFAQTPPPAAGGKHGGEMQKRWTDADLDKDAQLSKAEAQVAGLRLVSDHFDAIDANKDGKVSQDELRAWGQASRAEHRPKSGAIKGKQSDDTNRHLSSPPQAGQNGAPLPPSGFKSPEERRAAVEERFKKSDTNGDGGLSKAEVQASGSQRLLDHFDAIDVNKDGKVTGDELRNFWQQRQGGPRK